MRLMLVDDDARMRLALAGMLRDAGLNVCAEASDGQEALERIEGLMLDLILTDCSMPRMDGIELVAELRRRGVCTPVIMLSGQHDPAHVVRAIRSGVSNYVPKPIHPQALLEKIWQTLGLRLETA